MANNFQTRRAAISDSQEIIVMQRALAEYCAFPMADFAINKQTVEDTITSDEQAAYFVSEADDELAGMMLCHRIPLGWRGVSGVYIEDLYVKPEYRHGLGIGRLLMGRACELAVQLAGGDHASAFVRLDTGLEDNEDTLRFYRRLGMNEGNINFRLYGNAVADLANKA